VVILIGFVDGLLLTVGRILFLGDDVRRNKIGRGRGGVEKAPTSSTTGEGLIKFIQFGAY
jgi:hypothetical protein